MNWVQLIQGTAFPIVACVALAIFVNKILTEYRVLIDKINTENNMSRERDTVMITSAVKENTGATYELSKAIGELQVRIEMKHNRKDD